MEYGNSELDEKYHYSFHTDDSFDPICDGPMLCPVKPDCVPLLDFACLSEYKTSSEEDDQSHGDMDEQEEETDPVFEKTLGVEDDSA